MRKLKGDFAESLDFARDDGNERLWARYSPSSVEPFRQAQGPKSIEGRSSTCEAGPLVKESSGERP